MSDNSNGASKGSRGPMVQPDWQQKTQSHLSRSLPSAYSRIQELYIMEKKGGPMDSDAFTLSYAASYVTIGLWTAIKESLVWFGGHVVIIAILNFLHANISGIDKTSEFFSFTVHKSPIQIFFEIGSYGAIIFSTTISTRMGQYYAGNNAKKAINNFFITRCIFNFVFALLIFLALGLVNRFIMHDAPIAAITSAIAVFNSTFAQRIELFMHVLKRDLFESAMTVLIIPVVSTLIPLLSIIFFGIVKRSEMDMGPGKA